MKHISDILSEIGVLQQASLHASSALLGKKVKVHIMALGDVGTNMCLGLLLMGGDVISEIGLCDLNNAQCQRLEAEFGQITYPFPSEGSEIPKVTVITYDQLFDADVVIFCASKSVPKIGATGDMRMAQLEANSKLIAGVAQKAREAEYQGAFFVVSDPVDPLCSVYLKESQCDPALVRGFGLGVMNGRARYYAKKEERFADYLTEGRAFGPHGEDLVIANSLTAYDDEKSKELTKLAVTANMKVRELGFKPFIAPSISSAAISIILTLRGEWNYGSVYFGDETHGAFLGIKSRWTNEGTEYENAEVSDELYLRIKNAYLNLYELTKRGDASC